MSSAERAFDRPIEPVGPLPAPETPGPLAIVPAPSRPALDVAVVHSLQRTAGNAAVSGLMAGSPPLGRSELRGSAPTLARDLEIAAAIATTAGARRDTADPTAPIGPASSEADPEAPGARAVPMPSGPKAAPGAETTVPMPSVPTSDAEQPRLAAVPMPSGPAVDAAQPPVDAVPMPSVAAAPDAVPAAVPAAAAAAAPEAAPLLSTGPSAAPSSARPRGRGGAPQPALAGRRAGASDAPDGAPVPAGSTELDTWKAAAAASTAAIAEPKLDAVAAAPASLADQAAATEAKRAGERPDFAAQAREQLPAEPKPPAPVEQLDTKAADTALATVDAAGKVRLSDQAFPPMRPLPAGLAPPAPPTPAVPPSPVPDATVPSVPGGQVLPDPNAMAAADKLAAVAPVAAGKGPADGAVVSDPGAASLDPLPPAQAAHTGDVAARVLAEAPAYARQIVDAARATLDPDMRVSSVGQLADTMLASEQSGLTSELGGIAAAAGVTAEQLQAKVAARQEAAVKAKQAADQQLDQAAAGATQAAKQRGTDELQQISGASAAVKEEVARKQEAAKGTSDPSVINARRDAYLEKVQASVAAGSARLRAAKEKRIADLERVGGDQKAAYRRQAQTAAGRVEGQDDTAKRIAARPVLDWADQEALEVDGHVARLSRLATEEVERHEQAIMDSAQAAHDQIRDWAVEKQGRQRSWWERLLDMFRDYTAQAVASNQAWEAQRNAETRDAVASDLTLLAKLRDDMAAGNREAVMDEMARMSAEERAVVAAFLKSGGRDAIGAVAAGLVARIKAHRVPELGKRLEETAIADLPWEQLNLIGAIQTPGFDAGLLVREVRGAVNRIGTNETRLFAALTGRTPLQIAAMRKAYKAVYDRDMDEDIDDEVSGSEQERADALRSGDPTAGAVATLHDAMDGAGTSESLIMQTLRGKTPAQRDAITAAYETRYGVSLKSHLKSEMGGYELGEADALLEGDTVKADAMALKEAMDGAGTSEKGINAVYTRIRDEVEAEAVAKGMKTAEIEAEIKRRTAKLKTVYGNGDQGALEADLRGEMQGGELNLALAYQAVDQTAVDAATLQVEHESMWTGDGTVNDVLKAQYTRAEKEVMRDLLIDFNERAAGMPPAERKAAWAKEQERGRRLAWERSQQYMGALQSGYDDKTGAGGFEALIEYEVSGYARDEAQERIASGGKLSDAKELKYAIYGAGTKEKVIQDTLKGKSKEEIEQLKALYKAETDEELIDDLKGDLSGRDEADATILLETGDSTLEEKLEYLKRRKEWELGAGTGVAGDVVLGEEERVLTATTAEAEAAYKEYARLKALGDDDPQVVAARERLERWLGYGEKDIERHREEMDAITDTMVLVAGIAAGVAVTVFTAGVGATAVAAVAASFGVSVGTVTAATGAIAALATGMAVKQGMKSDAYGGEDIAIDLAQGTADAVVAVATAGSGAAALKALSKARALSIIGRAAEGGVLKRLAYQGVEGGLEGMFSGVPSGMVAAMLDENTWKSANPLAVIMAAGGDGAVTGMQMGGATAAGYHGASSVRAAVKPRAKAQPRQPYTPSRRAAPGDGAPPSRLPEGSGPVETPVVWPEGSGPAEQDTGRWERPGSGPESDGVPERIGGDPDSGPVIEETGPITDTEPSELPEHGPDEQPVEIDIDTVEPIADPDSAPPIQRPDPAIPEPVVDEPTGKHEVPSQEPSAVPEPTSDAPTDKIDTIPLIELPDGSIVYGGEQPFTFAEAHQTYRNAIADSPSREALILENVETGEHVVVQGSEALVQMDAAARAEFLADRLGAGTWLPVRHSHPVGEGNVTAPELRYPSGMGGDLAGVQADALATGRAREETIDIVTESGPQEIRFGFDPDAERPFWIERPGPDGRPIRDDFASLEGYHEFYERETGLYYPPPDPVGAGGRNAPATEPVDELPDGSLVYGENEASFTLDDAQRIYDNMVAAARDREVMIMQSIDTDEIVVIQGGVGRAAASSQAWAEHVADRGGASRWRGIRHSHGVGDNNLTRPQHRLPSGVNGDMTAARLDALKQMRPHREILDIVTEHGPQEVRFGYDLSKRPWFVEIPRPEGGHTRHDFANLVEYHRFFERETGHPAPVLDSLERP